MTSSPFPLPSQHARYVRRYRACKLPSCAARRGGLPFGVVWSSQTPGTSRFAEEDAHTADVMLQLLPSLVSTEAPRPFLGGAVASFGVDLDRDTLLALMGHGMRKRRIQRLGSRAGLDGAGAEAWWEARRLINDLSLAQY